MSKRFLFITILLFCPFLLQAEADGANRAARDGGFLVSRSSPWTKKEVPDKERLSSCGLRIEKIGCYDDKSRPLPELILTDRDRTSNQSDGHIFDWDKPEESMRSLVCRCAKRVLQKQYTHFSLQYYAECWSGRRAESTYDRDGPSEKICIGKGLKECDKEADYACTGMENSNYVYRVYRTVIETPAPPSIGCRDTFDRERCMYYANLGWCKTSSLVRSRCRRSCRMC